MQVVPSRPGAGPWGRVIDVVADDGVRLHAVRHRARRAGRGPTVVLAHGYALGSRAWQAQVRALTCEGFDVVTYDQRGHGASGHGDPTHDTIDQLGRDLLAVIRQTTAEGERLALVGHSMGGMTLMSLARQHPEVVAERACAAAFVATSAGDLAGAGYGLGDGPVRRRLASLVVATVPQVIGRVVRDTALRPPGGRAAAHVTTLGLGRRGFGEGVDRAVPQAVATMHLETPWAALGAFLTGFATHDEREALAVFRDLPALVIVGDADRLTPPEHSAAIVEALGPGSTTHVVVERAGHVIMMEQPDAVTSALVGLLDQVRDQACGAGPEERDERADS